MGKDVAEALGYFNTSKAIRNHVSEDDLKTLNFFCTVFCTFIIRTVYAAVNDLYES